MDTNDANGGNAGLGGERERPSCGQYWGECRKQALGTLVMEPIMTFEIRFRGE